MTMARIVLGNRDGVMALHLASALLQQLTDEWPDVNLVLRTVPTSAPRASAGEEPASDSLLDALASGTLGIAIAQAETLPPLLPEGITIAGVTRRLEPRSAFLARNHGDMKSVPAGARVGVSQPRDASFLRAHRSDLELTDLVGSLDDQIALLATGDLQAIVTPAAPLFALGQRDRIKALLEPNVVTPAIGQGATALLVRSDDDPAFEIAYSLQHRASFDRLTAERGFREGLGEELDGLIEGALATVTDDGEVHLFGAVVRGTTTFQATAKGTARNAGPLGQELGKQVLEQLRARP